MPVEMDAERFDEIVERALDEIPDDLAARVDNLAVLVEDEPPADQPSDLLGLYDGFALTERDTWTAQGLPNQIFIFRKPLFAFCRDEEELVEQIRITVVHEIAHHFGIDDDRLHELGYG